MVKNNFWRAQRFPLKHVGAPPRLVSRDHIQYHPTRKDFVWFTIINRPGVATLSAEGIQKSEGSVPWKDVLKVAVILRLADTEKTTKRHCSLHFRCVNTWNSKSCDFDNQTHVRIGTRAPWGGGELCGLSSTTWAIALTVQSFLQTAAECFCVPEFAIISSVPIIRILFVRIVFFQYKNRWLNFALKKELVLVNICHVSPRVLRFLQPGFHTP